MAKLHRIVKPDDRHNTHIFTFLLPVSLAAETTRDIISSEFMCGYQKWNIALEKKEGEKQIGAYLTLKNPSPGTFVTADYSFTLLNKGHYAGNESFSETNVLFTKHKPTQGRRSFVSSIDVRNPAKGFLMEKDQLIVEVMLCNFRTHFEYQLQLPMTEKERLKYSPNDVRLETGFFPYGGSEWSVNLKINEKNLNDMRGGSTVNIRRLSNFDHYCKFKYRIHIGVIDRTPLPGQPAEPKPLHPNMNKVITSNEMDSLFIDSDTQDKLVLPANLYKLATIKGVISFKIECYQAIVLTLLQIPMDKNRHKALRCYDRDKQAWQFEAHMKSDRLKFYVFYGDIATVPRGCIRMMNIGVSVLPAYGKVKLMKAVNSPYCKYYIQRHQDDFGLEVITGILMKDIICEKSIYIYDSTNSLTVQIEWGDSYLLKETEYSMADNIPRLHKMQMEREMKIIQKENLILEKQVHSYQTAIAHKDSKGEYDPNQVATRPQPPGQAQPGYTDSVNRTPGDPYNRLPNQMNNMQITGGHPSSYLGGNPTTSPHNTMNNFSQYNNSAMSPHGTRMDQSGSYGGSNVYDHQAGTPGMPVPADRAPAAHPRSRSADAQYYTGSVQSERRPNRRNSTTGAEYADYLEQSPNSRHYRQTDYKNADGYRSDSGYRSDTMTKASNDGRYPADPYAKEARPRPLARPRMSDTRSDFGDYHSEKRSKNSAYAAGDRDIDAYSDRSQTSVRGQRRSNVLASNIPTGRASYAGYENEYLPTESGYSHGKMSVGSPAPNRSSGRYSGSSYTGDQRGSRRSTQPENGYDISG